MGSPREKTESPLPQVLSSGKPPPAATTSRPAPVRESLARQASLVVRPTPTAWGAPAGRATGSPFSFPAAATTRAPRLNANLIAEQIPLILAQLLTPRENSKLMLITWALWLAA